MNHIPTEVPILEESYYQLKNKVINDDKNPKDREKNQ